MHYFPFRSLYIDIRNKSIHKQIIGEKSKKEDLFKSIIALREAKEFVRIFFTVTT